MVSVAAVVLKLKSIFKISGSSYSYTLKTCSGCSETAGRRVSSYTVESVDKKISIHLPTLLECNQIPNIRTEIPTPEAAYHHAHLKRIADKIPPLDQDAEILLLLGRDILQVHKVREQISGPGDAPFVQRLDLGWVVVGNVCLGGAHRTQEVRSYKTAILENVIFNHATTRSEWKRYLVKRLDLSIIQHQPPSAVPWCSVETAWGRLSLLVLPTTIDSLHPWRI